VGTCFGLARDIVRASVDPGEDGVNERPPGDDCGVLAGERLDLLIPAGALFGGRSMLSEIFLPTNSGPCNLSSFLDDLSLVSVKFGSLRMSASYEVNSG